MEFMLNVLAWQNIPLIWIKFKNSHVKLPYNIYPAAFLVFAVNGNRDTFDGIFARFGGCFLCSAFFMFSLGVIVCLFQTIVNRL